MRDDYDLYSEIEEEREEAYYRRCARRDMDQGIDPSYSHESDDDDHE
jgi:hypothetical protein